MKKTVLVLLLLPMLGIVSCTKTKSCECADIIEGKLVYYNQPTRFQGLEIDASIMTQQLPYKFTFHIYGGVPKELQITDTIDVVACLKARTFATYEHTYGNSVLHKIKCIERKETK